MPPEAREGSLDAPTRHPLDWRSKDFLDPDALDTETRRVFDICHGCRRCFNLCDAFPRLFAATDDAPTGELDSVDSQAFKPVDEACTLCDMCFMTKCPYVPPHPFNLDFPHLMMRRRAASVQRGEGLVAHKLLAKVDRNARLARLAPSLANAATKQGSWPRRAMARLLGVDAKASLPLFAKRTFTRLAKAETRSLAKKPPVSAEGAENSAEGAENSAEGAEKIVLFPGCFVQNHDPKVGLASMRVLATLGCEVKALYPGCCGMPWLEGGHIKQAAKRAQALARKMRPWVADGWRIATPTASCGLMMKSEALALCPDDADVQALARAACDVNERVVAAAKHNDALSHADGKGRVVAAHLACHARAQNMGAKSVEMLRLVANLKVTPIERCSGHGGLFGVLAPTAAVARKFGTRTAMRARTACATAAATAGATAGATECATEECGTTVASDCPLAARHVVALWNSEEGVAATPAHPIEIVAQALTDGAPTDGVA